MLFVFLTIGARVQEGYVSVSLCACQSVTTLAATSYVFTTKIRYVWLSNRLFTGFWQDFLEINRI